MNPEDDDYDVDDAVADSSSPNVPDSRTVRFADCLAACLHNALYSRIVMRKFTDTPFAFQPPAERNSRGPIATPCQKELCAFVDERFSRPFHAPSLIRRGARSNHFETRDLNSDSLINRKIPTYGNPPGSHCKAPPSQRS